MSDEVVSIRLEEDILKEIQAIARLSGEPVASVIKVILAITVRKGIKDE
jgi:hypothetical protein